MPPSLISHYIPLVGTQILLVTCIRLIGRRVSVTLRPHHRDVRHIPGSASKHHARGLTDVNGYRRHLFWTSQAPCRYGQPSHGNALPHAKAEMLLLTIRVHFLATITLILVVLTIGPR